MRGLGLGLGLTRQGRSKGFIGVLDTLSTPATVAYALRLLRRAYSGPAIRVRHSVSQAEQDIYFTPSGDLNTISLLSFIGSNSGFIRTWYDQSGNGNHEQQSNAALQPSSINAGVIGLNGTRPGIYFNGSTYLNTAAAITLNPQTISSVARFDASPTINEIVRQQNSSGPGWFVRGFYGNIIDVNLNGNDLYTAAPLATPFAHIYVGNNGSGQSQVFLNGVAGPTSTARAQTPTVGILGIGNAPSGSETMLGHISESIIFETPLSPSDRLALTLNNRAYYGTP